MACNHLEQQNVGRDGSLTCHTCGKQLAAPGSITLTYPTKMTRIENIAMRAKLKNIEVEIRENTANVEMWYVRHNPVKFVKLGIVDVRAADDIRISYDFDRDGYKIEQASTFEWDSDDDVCDPDWQEVAFIQAWQRDKTNRG